VITAPIALATLAGCATTGSGAPITGSRLAATTYVHQAERLIADIAHTIAPGSTVTKDEADTGPSDCTAPFKGDVYWTITRLVHIPKSQGMTGQDLIPAVTSQLKERGYEVTNDGPGAGYTRLRAGTDVIDMSVLGYTNAPTIQFNIDTECGTP
jgi:hypothetical protein